MKVTEIEVHEISVPYVDWHAYALNHYYGPTRRTIYVAHTDTGLTGLGESGSTEPQEIIDCYLGTNPFDHMGDEHSLGLGTAMYDLMGKAAGVPVYKLVGQKYRSWVPVGSWTVSTHPRRMAETVERYAAQGYTWMKFHLSPFENVIDQTEAMQQVAPRGFRIHYDFTMHGTDDHMVELVNKLARYPIAGCFEDVLPANDLPGYVELRKRSLLPVVLHHCPLSASYEVLMGAADVYMLGHAHIGDAIRRAGLFAAGDIPFMLQNVGGNITRAMTTQLMAAFPTANFHFFSDCETWSEDVVTEPLHVVNGFVRVPESPGLGMSLDRDALNRLKQLQLREQDKWIIRSCFANGARMFHIGDPDNSIFMVRPDRSRLIPMSYVAPIETDYWDDDGTPEFRQIFQRIEREGMVLESS
ncbi:MAG: enolase C-terminal domain-like protein [Candidatus Latescibacterota bacterium]|nr:enolase C-terminal domain-like protein [Candidatus Latescibacterota bacterium]